MHRALILILSLCSFIVSNSAQSPNKQVVQRTSRIIQPEEVVTAEVFFEQYLDRLGLSKDDEFRKLKSEVSLQGRVHEKFQHTYKGLDVIGSQYVLHSLDGRVLNGNGHVHPHIDLEVVPKLSSESALEIAMEDMGSEVYNWQVPLHHHAHRPQPSLVVVDSGLPKFSGDYHLAYRFGLESLVPVQAYDYYIDAHTGELITKINLYPESSVPGTGETRYYGTQEITVDSISQDSFILRDPSRGNQGINIYNGDRSFITNEEKLFHSETSHFDLINENQDEVATDALYLTSRFYDLLKEEFDWKGLDNADKSMNCRIHIAAGTDYVNAYWAGSVANFGDGNCNNGPLVTAEVVAHEFMHGVIDYTSDLIYREESGAINESMADVMGQYVEYMVDRENFSWSLGNSFSLRDNLEPFRVLDDPTSVGDPEYYDGPNWRDGANVHVNSAIGNLFFVLLSDGKFGDNLYSQPYNVDAIGVEEAAKFIFHINRYYLTDASDYHDYYEASLLAAEEFFLEDLDLIDNVREAWKGVAIPSESYFHDGFELTMESEGRISTCFWMQNLKVEVEITNNGRGPYKGTEGYALYIFNGGNADTIFLTEEILPGESISLESSILLNDETIFIDYSIVDDESEEVDSDFTYITVHEHEKNDISVSVQPFDPKCFTKQFHFIVRVENESCDRLSVDEDLRYRIRDKTTGEVVFNGLIPKERLDLFQNSAVTVHDSIFLDITKPKSYLAEVIYIKDRNQQDNITEFEFIQIPIISEGYYNGFDSDDDLNAELLFVTNQSFDGIINSSNLRNYNSESWFYTTGVFDEPRGPLCADPNRNWEEEAGSFFSPISAQLTACIDLKEGNGSSLSFNMAQFRNENSQFAAIESSSLRVDFLSEDYSESFVLLGQEEASVEQYRYDLPSDFKGRVDLSFLTHTGNSNGSLDYDAILLDDFALAGSVSVTEEESATMMIYPNPTMSKLFLSDDSEVSSYRVYNVGGQIVAGQNHSKGSAIDVRHLDSGFYSLALDLITGETAYLKFIKL